MRKSPAEINVGAIVRLTEPDFDLVECFYETRNACLIDPVCGLKRTLLEANRAFLGVLDKSTVAGVSFPAAAFASLMEPDGMSRQN